MPIINLQTYKAYHVRNNPSQKPLPLTQSPITLPIPETIPLLIDLQGATFQVPTLPPPVKPTIETSYSLHQALDYRVIFNAALANIDTAGTGLSGAPNMVGD